MTPIEVLVAEDETKIADIQCRFVEKIEGFSVIGVANTIADTKDMVEILKPDLLLLDIYFPDGTGIDLMWDIRAQNLSVDIILITAAKEVNTLQEGIRGGVFDYILKPINFGRFQDALHKYQDHRIKLENLTDLEQQDVDNLLHRKRENDPTTTEMPKGIDPLTLDNIRSVIKNMGTQGFSAESIGGQMGISRTTARRYLEYLSANGYITAELSYGTVGRPERLYFIKD